MSTTRIESLLETVSTCIGALVREMECQDIIHVPFDQDGEEVIRAGRAMDGLVLRSLVEVVRGCEERVGWL